MLNRTHPAGRHPGATTDDLYREHYLMLVRLAVQLVDDQPTAEDLVQDVFTRVVRSDLANLSDPRRYLTTAVVNQARSVLRRRRIRRLIPVDREQLAEGADAQMFRNQMSSTVWKAIMRLPPRQRQAVVLRYYAEWSVPEIATALGITRGAVSSSLDRALNSLSDRIGALNANH
jgi:RNA polymerase sigma factor (sigma-70 family)